MELGGMAMQLLTPHSFLGLGWDEWLSILTIIGICYGLLRSVVKHAFKKGINEILGPIYEAIKKLTKAIDDFSERQAKANERLERGDKKFLEQEENIKDHERRITRLEDRYDKK